MSNTVKLKTGKRNRRAGNSSIRFVRVKSTERAWLLAGTALFAGVIGIGVAGAPTRAVAADCLETGAGTNVWNCNGATNNSQTLNPDGTFLVNVDGNPSPFLQTYAGGTAFTVNADGEDGTIDVGNPASIQNSTGNGFVLNDAGTVGITVDGRIEGGSSADVVSSIFQPGDGYRIVGDPGAITLDVNANGIIRGADDGLVVTAANSLVVNNRGLIAGRGLASSGANDSEGILVSSNGNFGSQIGGSVEINNYGEVLGNARSSLNPGGQGISVSTSEDVTIRNHVEYDNEDVASLSLITGTNGIIVSAGGEVRIENDGHIQGYEGAGISIRDANRAEVQNHSYASLIGATNGLEFIGIAGPAIYAGGDGLVFGQNGDGLYFTDITNITGDDTVQVYSNRAGIVMGSEDGVGVYGPIAASTNGGAVNIDNGVYFDVGYSDWDDTSTAYLRRNDGGLIWGINGSGIDIYGGSEDVVGDININNQGTLDSWFDMQSEDAPDIDSIAAPYLGLLSMAAVDFTGHEDGLDIPRGIIGDWAGIAIGSTTGNININNGGFYANGTTTDDRGTPSEDDDVTLAITNQWIGGGQIIGIDGFGVYLNDIDGNVNIYNGNDDDATQRGGVIVGMTEDGVGLWGLSGSFNQNNDGGVTYGAWNGINLHNVDGVETEDGRRQAAHLNNVGGTVWGNDADGFHLWGANGDVNIDGPEGTIYGYDDGVRVGNVLGGSFYLNNAGGWIQGYTGDGVQVSGVQSEDFGEDGILGGEAWVENGDFNNSSEDWGGNGGLIIGAETAVSLHAERAGLQNGSRGIVIGQGSWNNPVVELYTNSGGEDGRTAQVFNRGLMTSDNFPDLHTSATTPDGDDLTNPLAEGALQTLLTRPITDAEYDDLLDEQYEAYQYVWSAGQSGTGLPDFERFADASNDVLIKSRGGALDLYNEGTMFGRINSDGTNYDDNANLKGAQIINFGNWFTTDSGQWGNEIHGSSRDQVLNGGWIQTALDGSMGEYTSFNGVNEFRNGGVREDFFGEGDDLVLEYGLLSMLDGGVGDETYITHDFYGSEWDDGTHSTLAVDIAFAYTPMVDRSDYLIVEEAINDSTGVIFNRVSPEGSTTVLGDRIYFAESEYRNNYGDNAFFIDPNSDNYIEVDGVAAIQDGLYAWYEDESGGVGDDYDYYLESTFAPQAVQLPSLITAAQNIWHDTAGQVADHVYGNHFPLAGNGGGGADLPVGELPVDAAAAPGAALWAKVTGSWTDRNTEVVQEIPPAVPVTIDTSFVQDTFSVLAGADFQPMGGGDDGLRAGVFGGYVSSNLTFDSYGASADFSGGIVGAYAAYTMGGFYADAEVKADLLQVTYAAPISPGFEVTGASTSIGILANTGYRMEVGDSAFFEPIASLSFVSTELEGFDAGGASVEFSNGNSLQGGIGARAGVTLGTPGDTTTEVAVLGKIWNEFEDANVVTVTDGLGNSASFTDGISGVFGELSGSATVYSADKSFSAFGSAGVKFNDSFTTVDAKVGVRKGF